MKIIIDQLILTCIVVFVVDYSGFTESWKRFISKFLTKGRISSSDYTFKPFDCSLCLSFWTTVIYTIAVGEASLYTIATCFGCGYAAQYINDIYHIIQSVWGKIISKII